MTYKTADEEWLAKAIRTIRKTRNLSQEDFSDVSSRTYVSSLERGLKSPTVGKLSELCAVMEVHPVTLLTLAYASKEGGIDQLLDRVRQELEGINNKKPGNHGGS